MSKRKTPYRSKVKIGVDAQGKDIVKYIQGYTRAELDQARQAVIARYITGEAPEADRLFGDYATEWFRVRKEPFVSAATRESYRTALNKHLFPVLGNRMLRAITPLELQELLNQYAGKSKSMITSILATLRGVYGAALADRIVLRDPTERLVRPPATPTAVKPALTAEQRAAIASIEKGPGGLKVKFYDKLKALELLVKYQDQLTAGTVTDPRDQPLLRAIRESTGKVVDRSDIEELQQAPAAGDDLVDEEQA